MIYIKTLMKKLVKHPQEKLRFRNKNNISRRAYYSQFVILFYIRNANITLERDATEILRMLKELLQLTNRSKSIFSTYCNVSQQKLWQSVLVNLNENIQYIIQQFAYIRENIIKKNKINSSIFWEQNYVYMSLLTCNHEKHLQMGNQILPKEEIFSWKTDIYSFYDEILSLLTTLTNICRLESDFIEKYTPKKFNKITIDIIKNIPKNHTLEEARKYEQEYLKVLTDYSMDTIKKSNLWDSLLYMLSGGIYQLPSEQTIIKRWLNIKMKEELFK